jgi:hypothetical protein
MFLLARHMGLYSPPGDEKGDWMIGGIVSFLIGTCAVILGGKAFSPAGMPLTGKKNITGSSAKIIGNVCIVIGLLFMGYGPLAVLASQR